MGTRKHSQDSRVAAIQTRADDPKELKQVWTVDEQGELRMSWDFQAPAAESSTSAAQAA